MTTRKSNVGCLGCFWFIGLVFFTLLEAGILYWLNPLWLDERAFWRGEIYGPESFFVAATDDELEAMAPPLLTPEERVGLWHEMAVRADYDPDSGISMETVEGAKFEFMPGSIEGAPEIEIVPVHTVPPEMTEQRGVVPVGPLHDLRIGGAEHYDFGIGVPASFRYDPEAVGNGRIAVGTWVDDRWVELPSRVDSRTGTVTATLEHASLIGGIVIVGTAVIGTWGTQTASGRSLAKALGTNLDETYDTKNFAIHYSTRIGIAVPTDAVYPSTRGRTTTDVPLFVQDVGAYLEEAFAGLGELGISPAAAEYLRHDAFLRPSPDFGASPLGGPLLLDNDFRDPDSGAFPGDMAYRMRATCTHELVHVGQDPYFNTFTSTAARWWIEATAEYIANRFVASRGQALTGVDYYVDGTPKLLATPWDKSEGLASYAWARFLDWLATAKGVDTVALVKAVNGRGASLQNIDSALRSAGHEGLSPYFEDFAKAFHHENLWTGAFCDPSVVQAEVRQFERFGHLAARPRNASAVRLIVYREHTFAQRHLSATHVLFQGGPFPADARAKLVIHLPGVERDGGRHFAFAAGLSELNLPLTGSPTPLAPVELAGGTGGCAGFRSSLVN